MEWDDNLTLSALEHVMDIGPKGLVSYQSSDGTEPEDRITKYGNYVETLGENIDFGPNDAMGVIVSLTLDDGDQERPHRDNLFKSDYKKVGIACGPHKTEYQMCVMDFAYDFIAHNQQDEEVENMAKININGNIGGGNSGYSQGTNKGTSNAEKKIEQPLLGQNKQMVQQPQQQTNQKPNKQDESLSKNKNEKIDKNNEQQQIKKLEQNLLNTNQNSNFNGNKQDNNVFSQNKNISNNQSPLVKLSLERDDFHHLKDDKNNDDLINAVKLLNHEKKVIAKYVEITHKIIYTFEDGSTKETTETQNHKFDFSN